MLVNMSSCHWVTEELAFLKQLSVITVKTSRVNIMESSPFQHQLSGFAKTYPQQSIEWSVRPSEWQQSSLSQSDQCLHSSVFPTWLTL